MFSLTEVSYHSHLPDNKIKAGSQNINNFKNYSLVLFADPPWNAGCLSCCHTRGVCEESILPVGFLAFSIIVPILPSRELWGWIEFIYSEMFRFFLSDQTSRSTAVSLSSLTSKVSALCLLSWAVVVGAPLGCLRLSDVQIAITTEIIFSFVC